MSALLLPARALVTPWDSLPGVVEGRRFGVSLALLIATSCLVSAAFFLRWDPGPQVISGLEKAGELARATEAELASKIETQGRMALVGGLAKGLFGVPLAVLLLAAAMKFSGWLFETRAAFGACFAVGATGLLPLAVHDVLTAGALFAQVGVADPAAAAALVPSSLAALAPEAGLAARGALGALDFFKLWTVGLLGLGFAHASGMRPGRALLLWAGFYVMFAAVTRVALPAMATGASS